MTKSEAYKLIHNLHVATRKASLRNDKQLASLLEKAFHAAYVNWMEAGE